MNKKNDFQDIDLENNDEIEIEYNEDFTSEKTKSLTKFPTKITQNNEFKLDNAHQNFSKSLNFNFRQCFAPKSKSKKSSKNPTPIIFRKNNNKINNLNTQDQIITEDFLSEKGSSLNNESSFSSSEEYNNINFNINNENYNEDEIINKNVLEKKNLNMINENKNTINEIKEDSHNNMNKNIKAYEHKTISFFNNKDSSNQDLKESMKTIRNTLFKDKIKALKLRNKETEFKVKDKNKMKYRLDLQNIKKNDYDNDYKIIKINDIEENNSDKDNNEDMSKFRTTICYCNSKLNKVNNKKNQNKGVTIYDVLLNNKNKNKK